MLDFILLNSQAFLNGELIFRAFLSKKDKLRYASIETMRFGRGGKTYISKIFACDRKTIRKGIREIEILILL